MWNLLYRLSSGLSLSPRLEDRAEDTTLYTLRVLLRHPLCKDLKRRKANLIGCFISWWWWLTKTHCDAMLSLLGVARVALKTGSRGASTSFGGRTTGMSHDGVYSTVHQSKRKRARYFFLGEKPGVTENEVD